MTDKIGRWPLSNPPGLLTVLGTLMLGCKRDDGSTYWSRREYLRWVWRAHWRKRLFGPLRCFFGRHRISEKSDVGMGGSCCSSGPGLMDVWCLDCDRALAVPIDDVIEMRKAARVLDLWRGAKQSGGPSEEKA